MKRNWGSKLKSNWISCCDGCQTDQSEILDNYCHITSTSVVFALKVMLLYNNYYYNI